MKTVVIILFSLLLIAVLFVFQVNNLTGYYVKYNEVDLERKSEKTEVSIFQNPVKRGSSTQAKIIPGGSGIERNIELYVARPNGEEYLRSFAFCPQTVCKRGRIYSIRISKAYRPGEYKIRVHDMVYGPVDAYFKVA